MDITEMKNLWSSLGAQVRDCSAQLMAMAGDKSASREDIEKKNGELQDLQARLTAAKAAYDQELAAQGAQLQPEKREEKPMNTEIRSPMNTPALSLLPCATASSRATRAASSR
jgi:chromosome segregation ATPase